MNNNDTDKSKLVCDDPEFVMSTLHLQHDIYAFSSFPGISLLEIPAATVERLISPALKPPGREVLQKMQKYLKVVCLISS